MHGSVTTRMAHQSRWDKVVRKSMDYGRYCKKKTHLTKVRSILPATRSDLRPGKVVLNRKRDSSPLQNFFPIQKILICEGARSLLVKAPELFFSGREKIEKNSSQKSIEKSMKNRKKSKNHRKCVDIFFFILKNIYINLSIFIIS